VPESVNAVRKIPAIYIGHAYGRTDIHCVPKKLPLFIF